MAECKYYKLVRQVSYDRGVTWISLDEFQKGDLYETDSPDCGGGITQYRWVNVSGEYTCVGTTKYQKTKKQQSTDRGLTWTDVNPPEYNTGAVIEYNSPDCVGGNTKLSATYRNGQRYLKECDGNSILSSGETRPNGYTYTEMTSAVIGNCVTDIGGVISVVPPYTPFTKCTSLTSITIGNSVKYIRPWSFSDCSGLTKVVIPDSVEEISTCAFIRCTSITSVTLGNSVKVIGNQAFDSCPITSITIPNSVTTIGQYAFGGTLLRNVYIPSGVTSINVAPFLGCDSLTSITVDSSNNYYSSSNGALFNKEKSLLVYYPPGLTTFNIPSTVKTLWGYSVASCDLLTNVSIPEGVERMNNGCFFDCRRLSSVTIPSTVNLIQLTPFEQCYNIRSITCLATTPPTLTDGLFLNKNDYNVTIYVPSGSVNAYKSASGWSEYSSIIRAIS